MSVKQENGGDRGDDDEWGDLMTTPNRLISDDFFVLKAESIDDRKTEQQEEVSFSSDRSSLEEKFRSRKVSIAERRASKRGGDGNSSRISVSVSSSPVSAWSQFLTIPSGISPTSLLDSPVMLPNSQNSPTTGTFSYPPLNHEISGMNASIEDGSCDNGGFAYQTHADSLLWPYVSVSDLQNQSCEYPGTLTKETITKASQTEFKPPKTSIKTPNEAIQLSHNHNQTSPEEDETKRTTTDGYAKETNFSPMKNSEDGYNWRKYGQKQVKGSEYPRSYYKCTHPNCQVKKKVERSHDGHITEIIYKGAHNHQGQRNISGSPESYLKIDEVDNNSSSIRPDRMELSSSTSVVTDNSDLIAKSVTELSSSNGEYEFNEEDGTNYGDEADDDKSELKRRKKGTLLLETSLVTRAMREPRVVVQIESEVDILDDGYRWRKYGQKVVKGNPNPRSYYKCTSTGCPVRKHVERASDDLKSVLTTYEGKHNHQVPAARNSVHTTMDAASTSNTLSRPKSEPHVQDLPIRFDRKLSNGYIPSNFVSGFDNDPTNIYQTKYVPFQNPISYNSVLPDFPFSIPMTIPPGFDFNNNGKRARESFIRGQHMRDNNGRFLKPKLEQDDNYYDTFMRAPDHVNDAASRYCQVIPNFPS